MLNRCRIANLVLVSLAFLLISASSQLVIAQTSASPSAACKPVTLTTDEDQKNMMQQLGIHAMRPGPSGDEHDPKHANYDESQANPFPHIPDALSLNDGQKVTTPEMWQKRRAEILEGFDCCVYGRVPKNVPKVTWTVGSGGPRVHRLRQSGNRERSHRPRGQLRLPGN